MRKIILALVLGTLSLSPLFSQEAFYIYRNDSDFNGFFYDEVVEMRYSKFDYDSVEHEQYVMYEVQLADTLYRIPLAAIDSIGFQQPEIKFNPRVKFMERDGYSPYVDVAGDRWVEFKDLPISMMPQIGDIFIGLPSDNIADTKYNAGSVSCVVEQIQDVGLGYIYVEGHAIEQLGDVFEQFITVEQIGVDKNGKQYRRLAGCTKDGRINSVNVAADSTINIIDFTGTFTKSVDFSSQTKFDITADITFVWQMRATYNITWTKFYCKISKDFIFKVKPSIGLSIETAFDGTAGSFFELPPILFPANCPVFQLNPYPEVFLKAVVNAQARLNLPLVQFNYADDLVMDRGKWFPIMYSYRLGPEEDAELLDQPESYLDLSGEIQLSGSLHTGIEFEGEIKTANWFKKVFQAGIGLHMYVGPKVSAAINLTRSIIDGSSETLYSVLRRAYLSISLLDINIEAGAKAWAMWGDPEEVTFFNKELAFMTDTFRLAPGFKPTTYEQDGSELTIYTHPEIDHVLGSTRYTLGIYRLGDSLEYVGNFGDWIINPSINDYSYTFSKEEIKSLPVWRYCAAPIVKSPIYGDLRTSPTEYGVNFWWPFMLEFEGSQDSIVFNATDNLEQSISFKTNCPNKKYVSVVSPDWVQDSLVVLNEATGEYKVIFKAQKNHTLFDRSYQAKIVLGPPDDETGYMANLPRTTYSLTLHQDPIPAPKVALRMEGKFSSVIGEKWVFYEAYATGRRTGDKIEFTGTFSNPEATYSSYTGPVTKTVQFTIERGINTYYAPYAYDRVYLSNGELTEHFSGSDSNKEIEYTTQLYFTNWDAEMRYVDNYFYINMSTSLSSGQYDEVKKQNDVIKSEEHETMDPSRGSKLQLHYLRVILPGEE